MATEYSVHRAQHTIESSAALMIQEDSLELSIRVAMHGDGHAVLCS